MKKPENKEQFITELYASIDTICKPLDPLTERLWGELWDALQPQGMKREEAEELFSQLMFASDGMRTAGSMKNERA